VEFLSIILETNGLGFLAVSIPAVYSNLPWLVISASNQKYRNPVMISTSIRVKQ